MRNVRVSIEGLADAVNEALQEYVELATDDMKTAVQNAGITVVNEIKLFSWLGGKLNTATTARLASLDSRVAELKTQLTDMWINSHRQAILTYARECRSGVGHSSDEWSQILTVADEYEAYCVKHTISNGVVKADTKYIRDLYHELSKAQKL